MTPRPFSDLPYTRSRRERLAAHADTLVTVAVAVVLVAALIFAAVMR